MSSGYSRDTFINADEKTMRGITFDMLSDSLEGISCLQRQHADHIEACRRDLEYRTNKYQEKFANLDKLAIRFQESKKRNWFSRSVWFLAGAISGITGKILGGFDS